MSRQADLRTLNVVAGILRDDAGRVLISERIEQGPFCGLWEFPGGKIADGETSVDALTRELAEEIGVEPEEIREFMSLAHEYADRHVSIEFFLVEKWRNEPAGLEGQQLKWVHANDLAGENLLPADIPVIEALADR
ncbi:MAG: 8-oxo-dGTP diphosphatase MutT [Woeseiaceae bacterium]